VEVPIYNFVTHRRNDKTVSMYGANVLIFEGILAFHDKDILDMLDMKIFVDTDSDIRLTRRLTRDISQRGRDLKVNTFTSPLTGKHVSALALLPSEIFGNTRVCNKRGRFSTVDLLVKVACFAT